MKTIEYYYTLCGCISALMHVVNFQDKPPEAYISRVKTVERKVGDKTDSRETYRRVKYWRLPELRLVDGKSVDTEVLEFDLHFDKGVFKWIASNIMEKKNFIICLYKVTDHHCGVKFFFFFGRIVLGRGD